MPQSITPSEGQAALTAAQVGRQKVVDEIGMPWWYWWSLASGWIGLGFVFDLSVPWYVDSAAGLIFGAGHAAMYSYVGGGRHRTRRLTVRRETVGPHVSLVVIGSLLGLGALTTAVALLVRADGAAHPVTIASTFVAVTILLGGPAVMRVIRRRASR